MLKRNGPIRTSRLGNTKLANNISAAPNVVDQLAPFGGDGPHFHEANLKKEKRAFTATYFVKDLIPLEGSRFPIGQNCIAKLPAKDSYQCRRNRRLRYGKLIGREPRLILYG
jgi:hypothetical protein